MNCTLVRLMRRHSESSELSPAPAMPVILRRAEHQRWLVAVTCGDRSASEGRRKDRSLGEAVKPRVRKSGLSRGGAEEAEKSVFSLLKEAPYAGLRVLRASA